MPEKQPKYAAPAVERALDILEKMAEQNRSFTATEMALALDISSNSAFRIFKELEKKGYVLKNAQDSSYQLTEKLYYLGSLLQNRVSLRKVAQPSMERLRDASKETILLTKFGAEQSTFIVEQLPGLEPIKFLSTVGISYDSYHSALGKAMLAASPAETQQAYIANTTFIAQTPNTITDPAHFTAELARIATEGIAFDREEAVSGLYCLGCPIVSAGQQVVGAIGISGVAFRMTQEKVAQYVPLLQAEAKNISRLLGGKG